MDRDDLNSIINNICVYYMYIEIYSIHDMHISHISYIILENVIFKHL